MGEEQTSLEGFVVLRLEDLEEAVERVLKKHGILGPARKRPRWDMTPKGNEYWRLFRAKVLGLVRRNLIVSFSTLKQDPWFATNERQPMDHATKWQRAYDQHLIQNRPPGTDGFQFRAFQLRTKDTVFLTVETYLHCAIAKAAEGRKKARGLIREARRRFGVEARCAWCARPTRDETVEEDVQLAVVTHPPGEEEPLTEDETALLQARRAQW